ncbi:MAG: choice-of-anchor J domain-containing protein [Planctomycetes bacterium]|nr:choice-of-anchor J domain-containing protein [Planctomycetota bacterium]
MCFARNAICVISGLIVAVGTVATAFAQASYVEAFDDVSYPFTGYGPFELIARGWEFRMQSSPASYPNAPWYDGEGPQAGPGCLRAWHGDTLFSGSAQISNWAILPAIANQQSGDEIAIWLRGLAGASPGTIEVRYSPSGGNSTGSGPSGVGNFTSILIAANPTPGGSWTRCVATVPGNGRVAIRATGVHSAGTPSVEVLLDSLTVGAPCPLPPLPTPGQTVTWSLANSPYELCRDAEIVAGGTVIVEPGVEVRIPLGTSLRVAGTLRAIGTSASPCLLTTPGAALGWAGTIDIAGGSAELTECDVNLTLVPYKNSVLSCDRSRFQAAGFVTTAPNSFLEVPHTVVLSDCTFDGGGTAYISDANVALRNVQFTDPSPIFATAVLGGFVVLDNVAVNGSLFWIHGNSRDNAPFYLRGLHVTGVPSDPALLVTGNNVELSSDCTLQSGLFPVHLDYGAGLLPGTSIPGAGNVNNYVRLGRPNYLGQGVENAHAILANVGVPYVAEANGNNQYVPIFSATLTILPGTTVLMKPNTYWDANGGSLVLRGLPNAPITFDRFDPSTPWGGFGYTGAQRIENCIIRGSTYGTTPGQGSGALRIDNSLYENNLACTGLNVTVRKTQFLNNAAVNGLYGGDFSGQTNPNAFVGNAETIHHVADARFNWWGDPSGPFSPANPGGAGDPIGDSVPFLPFLTTAPDFTDAPPVVNVRPPAFNLESGRKIVLAWDVINDGPISSQTVLFSDPVNGETVIAAGLPGSQRSLEWTIPQVPTFNGGSYHVFTVRAFDAAGQEGYEALPRVIPAPLGTTQLTLTSDFDGQTFRSGGQMPPITWNWSGLPRTVGFELIDDNTGRIVPAESSPMIDGQRTGLYAPNISSDHVRLFLRLNESGGNMHRHVVDGPFAIRPDPLLGDAPPTVQMLTPQDGASFPGGGVVPITWTASDDDALRSFSVQVSFDTGRSWDSLVVDLPAAARSYNWRLPPSTGIADVRVRVIAQDLRSRFRATSTATVT